MGDLLTPVHLIIVLGIALLVFGPKRLPELGAGLGKSLREFREATSGMTSAFSQDNLMPTATPQPYRPGMPTAIDPNPMATHAMAMGGPAPMAASAVASSLPDDIDTGG